MQGNARCALSVAPVDPCPLLHPRQTSPINHKPLPIALERGYTQRSRLRLIKDGILILTNLTSQSLNHSSDYGSSWQRQGEETPN